MTAPQISTRPELVAWTDLAHAAAPDTGRHLGICVVEHPAAVVLSVPGVDSVLWNRVMGLGELAPPSERDVAALVGELRARGAPRYFVQSRAGALPDAWLENAGLERFHRRWIEFQWRPRVLDADRLDAAIRIRPATLGDAASLARLFGDAFDLPQSADPLFAGAIGRPRWHAWVACDGELVVGAGLLFVTGELAYLAGGAVRPSHRRRGIQRALMRQRLELAAELGCRLVHTETGEPVPGQPNSSHHNMLACGFRQTGVRDNWVPPGTSWGRR